MGTASTRSQVERSAATRARLLSATFESLHEHGYAGTSTAEVCRRSGVSRGAMLHHYPSKHELVAAAADHVFQRRLDAFRRAIRRLPEGPDRLDAAIELLWEILSGPTYYAWLELVVASRTDEALRERIRGVMERFGQDVAVAWAEIVPRGSAFPDPEAAPTFTFALLNGLAVDRIWCDEADVRPAIESLKLLARLFLDGAPPGPERS